MVEMEMMACAFPISMVTSSADRLCVSCYHWECIVEMVEIAGSWPIPV